MGGEGKDGLIYLIFYLCFSAIFLFFSNRRELKSIDGVQQISLEEALSSQEVEVAYICSESSSHENYIRWVFSAGGPLLAQSCGTVKMAEQTGILLRGLNNQWENYSGSMTFKNCSQNVKNPHYW